LTLFMILIIGSSFSQEPNASQGPLGRVRPPRILLVVAHPDDEYDMAATVYRLTTELHRAVDEIVITNGESGYRYASLAERYYGVALADDSSGRERLAQIRTEESRHAAKVLGIRQQWFLGEKNNPYTQSPDVPLNTSWHTDRIIERISEQLKKGDYDFVLVSLPEAETHGEHKAAAILALRAVSQSPTKTRPVVLGAAASNTTSKHYEPIASQPLTTTLSPEPEFHFDRNSRFGYNESLSYQIVVDWVIAEHKSQGLFQTKCLQDRYENFWLFNTGASREDGKTATLFASVSPGNPVPEPKQETQSSQKNLQN
jgi:N-acetylglucosamine malate deacetylase 2